MNEPTVRLETRPEVSAFVERVRERLADLTEEEREELVGGLEADIDELVSDGGSLTELGDPRAYADELRSAAGLGPSRPAASAAAAPHRSLGERVEALLDSARRDLAGLAGSPRFRSAWDFAVTLRPVWWVLRAWVAVQLLALYLWGGQASAVPMVGGPVIGSALWLVAVVVSVQIGRGAVWPGSGPDRAVSSRLVLLGLNAFAILVLPMAVEQLPSDGMWQEAGHMHVEPVSGLALNGAPVGNVFPYDAEGNPLAGVQLFDEDGRPLRVRRWALEETRGNRVEAVYPWLGAENQHRYNVFPLPTRDQSLLREGSRADPGAWATTNPPVLPTPPLVAVPSVSLPSDGASEGVADRAGVAERDSENAGDR